MSLSGSTFKFSGFMTGVSAMMLLSVSLSWSCRSLVNVWPFSENSSLGMDTTYTLEGNCDLKLPTNTTSILMNLGRESPNY